VHESSSAERKATASGPLKVKNPIDRKARRPPQLERRSTGVMRHAIGALALATVVSGANLAAQTQHQAGQANSPPGATAQPPQASTEPPVLQHPKSGNWSPMPDIMPKGAEMQVLHGDPASGAAAFYFKVPPNYTFPWHFHTPVEKLFPCYFFLASTLSGRVQSAVSTRGV
jgi:hypothetical protein